jgi:hypothetical protein
VLDDTQRLNKKLLRNSLKDIRHRFLQVKKQDSIVSTIYQSEKENKIIGMVALLKTKQGFFEKLIHEPVFPNLAFKTEVPLLVIPQRE